MSVSDLQLQLDTLREQLEQNPQLTLEERGNLTEVMEQIQAQFLVEAILLCALGGVSGVVLGLLGTAAWSGLQGWPLVVPVETILSGMSAALVTGAVAGLAPSIRAARQSPTAALAAT